MRPVVPSLRVLGLSAVLVLSAAAAVAQTPAGQPPAKRLLGDATDGSRARPVHVIPLRDADGEVIRPTDRPLLPFSPPGTCAAECHDVKKIARGWHFNVMEGRPDAGRRGEPWILVDLETATQLPLSYSPGAGAFHPDQVGMSPWAFASMFGARTPGGLSGTAEPGASLKVRWDVSGSLEVNCLACHDGSPAYDHAEYGRQVQLQNFRWAPAAASGLALVTGSAREMPATFDYLLPFVEDALQPRMPTVTYAPERFLPGSKVVFDIVREVPDRRCYFCHSNADLDSVGERRWNADEDIHLARGMTCVDCHRNGLDHDMRRGYEGEPAADAAGGGQAALTCRGCHMASEPERIFARGRLGAPYPRHAGIPPIHFTKLSCTACHSGPRPEESARGLKTSQAHRLGGQNVNKSPAALPHLYYPVFAEQPDGTTTPNRLVWPAYWGGLVEGKVQPIAPERVKRVMTAARVKLPLSAEGSWPSLDEAMLAKVLGLLQADKEMTGTAVYVAGGKLHRLGATGGVTADEHEAAQPCMWPIAHDVRPASLALGARGCTDCHEATSPIFFGTVPVDTALASANGQSWPMHRFQKSLDVAYAGDFARTFPYRPWLKAAVSIAGGLVLLFLLAYAVAAVQGLSTGASAWRWTRVLVNVMGIVLCAAGVASGYEALVSGERLTGYALMIHVATAPAFAAGAVLVTLFWAERNRFVRADWNRLRRPFWAEPGTATSIVVLLRKLSFWVAVVSAIPVIASATLPLFPVMASVRQDTLFLVHRYAVVPLIVAAAVFTCLALVAWLLGRTGKKTRPAPVSV